MRYERVKHRQEFDIVDVARIWPRADGVLQAPLDEVEAAVDQRSAPAVPDLPAGVGRMIVGVYAALIAVFAGTMARGPEATFMITISGLYVAIFLAVPRLFLLVEDDRSGRPSLGRFLERGIDTHTGRLSGASAMVQIFVVPVLLTFAILAMGVAALGILP